MSKQLLIYERAVPITRKRHGGWWVKTEGNFSFASNVNSMPLLALEFRKAAGEYPIVFSGSDDSIMPAVLLGVRAGENLFVDETGSWDSRYIPAFARRYPFIFSSADDGETLTLCIDEEFSGLNQEAEGERLFDEQGERTAYLNNVLEFQKEFQKHYQRTREFCRRLKELDLLEPVQARFRFETGEQMALAGFMMVSRERLHKLDGDRLAQLAGLDELELIYLHLLSMQNISVLARRIAMTVTRVATTAAESAGNGDALEPPEADSQGSKGKKKGSGGRKMAAKKKSNGSGKT